MGTISHLKANLSGFSGAPGVNSWFVVNVAGGPGLDVTAANAAGTALRQFYTGVTTHLQDDVTVTIDPEVINLDDINGQPQGSVSMDASLPAVNGVGASPASHASMMKLRLRTVEYQDGRRIQGGPFIGPIHGGAIQDSGDLTSAAQTALTSAATDLLADFVAAGLAGIVWRRPRPASSPLGARDGSSALVTSVGVFSRPAVLRSRRD